MRIKTKDLIDFRGYSEVKKRNFASKLRQRITEPNQTESEAGGGDYWVRCISAINAACHDNDNRIL